MRKMVTKKDCVQRASMELTGDRNYAMRVADRAERMSFRGFETQIEEGKKLFMKDFDEGGEQVR